MQRNTTPLQAFLHWVENTPDRTFLIQRKNGQSIPYTFKEVALEARKFAAVLQSYDFPAESKIALLSKNCVHWFIADLAIMMSGHVSVPIYPTLGAAAIKPILEHSESKLIIVGKLDNPEAQLPGIPNGIVQIGMRDWGVEAGDSWEKLTEDIEPLPMDAVAEQPLEKLMTIIYTSGTTGAPKGVMHPVSSFVNFASKMMRIFDFLPDHVRSFSYLPLSHIAERAYIEIHGLYRGAEITFPESLDTFAHDLELTQPQIFVAVPRIWAKFREGVMAKVNPTMLKIPILNSIVKKKVLKKLGLAHCLVAGSGAAPLSSELQEWFGKMGLVICQAYGMTEDTGLSHINTPTYNKVGTVGKVAPDVDVKLSPEGEILIKSDTLTTGYFKEAELTAETFANGYLKTGDIGEYDHDGYLEITGRVKDQFKTDKGKYISPAPLELELLENADIDQVCIVGTGIPQPIALTIVSEEGKKKSKEQLAQSLSGSIKSLNPTLEKHEKIAKAVVMKEDWTVDNGLLTPTLKVKRNQVEKIHQGYYRSWFDTDGDVIFE